MNKIFDKLFIKQWSTGITNASIDDIISNKISKKSFTWLPIKDNTRFFADPFVFKNPNGNIEIIFEDYSSYTYGTISLASLSPQFSNLSIKPLLDTGFHLSYPSVFLQNNKTYIIPESSKEGGLHCYEFDFETKSLINKRTIIEKEPLLDSTILFHNNKYWLFATKRGEKSNSDLYIYHSHKWDGDYVAHKGNPVKTSLSGSRPAGNFIIQNNNIYRPTQNSAEYYGKSIILQKIIHLDEEKFEEIAETELKLEKNNKFNFGIHTINIINDVIVVDGLRKIFSPLTQIKIFLKKILKLN
jgi:hypothetical protein